MFIQSECEILDYNKAMAPAKNQYNRTENSFLYIHLPHCCCFKSFNNWTITQSVLNIVTGRISSYTSVSQPASTDVNWVWIIYSSWESGLL